VGRDPGQGLEVVALDEVLGSHHQGRCSVVDPRGVARGHGAVRLEGRAQTGQGRDRRLGPGVLVAGDQDGVPLALGNRDGHDLRLEGARLHRPSRLGLAGRGEGVLLFTRQREALGQGLGGQTHVLAREDVGQAIVDHGVDHLDGTHLAPLANEVGDMRGPTHVLGPSRHHALGISPGDHRRGQGHRLQARSANLVDRPGWGGLGNPSLEGGLAADALAQTGLQDAAHDDLFHLVRGHAAAAQGLPDDDAAQARCGNLAQPPQEGTDGSASSRYDVDRLHGKDLSRPQEWRAPAPSGAGHGTGSVGDGPVSCRGIESGCGSLVALPAQNDAVGQGDLLLVLEGLTILDDRATDLGRA